MIERPSRREATSRYYALMLEGRGTAARRLWTLLRDQVGGSPAAGHRLFPVGDHLVALGTHECPMAVAFDFGPGSECLFVYVPRQPASEERPGRWRKRGPA